jgi:hypothetical protein
MRSLFGAVALAAIAVTVVLIGTASAAKPPPPPPNSNCPTSPSNLRDALNVGASYVAGTYSVERFGPAAPTSLVKYCVYTDKIPTALAATAVGADGSAWVASKKAKTFSFSRPGGTPTNLALDGTNQAVGTATFGTEPTKNDIVLHISDGGQCFDLYGVVTPTCFVTPGEKPGPICDAAAASGDAANAAYNNIPKDAVDCGPPSHAFEGTQTKEFGDEVTLSGSGSLNKLTVLFNSYACKDFPLWNNSQCTTDPLVPPLGDTFTHDITAHIYAASSLGVPGALLASATETKTIPYRPSADPAMCGLNGGDPARWFNPVSGTCTYSKKVLLTFTNWDDHPDLTGNETVVWTVEFNTSHYGDTPLAPAACNATVAGCPYDSLNVGTKTFDNSPYAGEYVDDHGAFINSTWNGIYCDDGLGGVGFLRASTAPPTCTNTEAVNNYAPDAWLGYQPLGQIVLTP